MSLFLCVSITGSSLRVGTGPVFGALAYSLPYGIGEKIVFSLSQAVCARIIPMFSKLLRWRLLPAACVFILQLFLLYPVSPAGALSNSSPSNPPGLSLLSSVSRASLPHSTSRFSSVSFAGGRACLSDTAGSVYTVDPLTGRAVSGQTQTCASAASGAVFHRASGAVPVLHSRYSETDSYVYVPYIRGGLYLYYKKVPSSDIARAVSDARTAFLGYSSVFVAPASDRVVSFSVSPSGVFTLLTGGNVYFYAQVPSSFQSSVTVNVKYDAKTGVIRSATPALRGSPFTYSLSTPVAGVRLDANTGALSGSVKDATVGAHGLTATAVHYTTGTVVTIRYLFDSPVPAAAQQRDVSRPTHVRSKRADPPQSDARLTPISPVLTFPVVVVPPVT